jgi:cellobiose-specific phosphotransferase system component IIB
MCHLGISGSLLLLQGIKTTAAETMRHLRVSRWSLSQSKCFRETSNFLLGPRIRNFYSWVRISNFGPGNSDL